jgi:hypothetical protein
MDKSVTLMLTALGMLFQELKVLELQNLLTALNHTLEQVAAKCLFLFDSEAVVLRINRRDGSARAALKFDHSDTCGEEYRAYYRVIGMPGHDEEWCAPATTVLRVVLTDLLNASAYREDYRRDDLESLKWEVCIWQALTKALATASDDEQVVEKGLDEDHVVQVRIRRHDMPSLRCGVLNEGDYAGSVELLQHGHRVSFVPFNGCKAGGVYEAGKDLQGMLYGIVRCGVKSKEGVIHA